jgi:hypothetical protein
MSAHWATRTDAIAQALVNFLTLASFRAQHSLAYAFRFTAIADRMPPEWLGWFEPEPPSIERPYATLFGIDEEMCSGRVMSVSDVYVNVYVWGPRRVVMDAARYNRPIADPWFAHFLIPQVEIELSWNATSPVIPYCERAVVTKVISESRTELY